MISADGYIISSAFNFVRQPASILVSFVSGKQLPAELIATDHSRMLVLLKVNGVADLPVPAMAPLAEIRPGQWAVAVGRTFRADKTNVTVGIVSALGRMFGKAIQTDADVSLANYGGPLVTAGGLLFIGATNFDRKFHAYDKATGKLLWETILPASGNATPAVY